MTPRDISKDVPSTTGRTDGGTVTRRVGAELLTATWRVSLSLLNSGRQFKVCALFPHGGINHAGMGDPHSHERGC